jgi:threonine/homoserine/homoserine lactone efflux protein
MSDIIWSILEALALSAIWVEIGGVVWVILVALFHPPWLMSILGLCGVCLLCFLGLLALAS